MDSLGYGLPLSLEHQADQKPISHPTFFSLTCYHSISTRHPMSLFARIYSEIEIYEAQKNLKTVNSFHFTYFPLLIMLPKIDLHLQ